jgi:ABC-type dipeptide/oligopeptide/nickel transport system ATPase subunit
MTELLKLQNISVSFDNGKTYILKDISFSVFTGEILSII